MLHPDQEFSSIGLGLWHQQVGNLDNERSYRPFYEPTGNECDQNQQQEENKIMAMISQAE